MLRSVFRTTAQSLDNIIYQPKREDVLDKAYHKQFGRGCIRSKHMPKDVHISSPVSVIQVDLVECMDLINRGVSKAHAVANHDRNLVLDKARLDKALGAALTEAAAKVKVPSDAPMLGGRKLEWQISACNLEGKFVPWCLVNYEYRT